MVNEPEANQKGLIANSQDNRPYHKEFYVKNSTSTTKITTLTVYP